MTRKPSKKATESRISAAYTRSCSGFQISIMDTPKVFAEARKAVEAGADDAALEATIRAFVETIRKN